MNQLTSYNHDLRTFLLRGGDCEQDTRIRAELAEFDRRVKAVLSLFAPACHRALDAILRTIPDGNLDYMYTAWLGDLLALGILDTGQAAELREEHEKNPIAIQPVNPDPEPDQVDPGRPSKPTCFVFTPGEPPFGVDDDVTR